MTEETDLLLVEPSEVESREGPAGSPCCSCLCLLRSLPLAEPSSIPADWGPQTPQPVDLCRPRPFCQPRASLGEPRNGGVSSHLNCTCCLSEMQI